jgi:hypothetical protein
MIAFPAMLVDAAERAGMKVPPDPDAFDKSEFPHFACFCTLQLCRPTQHGEHWENAKVIARVPDAEITKLSLEDFLARGLRYQQ